MKISHLIPCVATLAVLFVSPAFAADACLVRPGAEGSTALQYRNDCDHTITIIKVAFSGGKDTCFRADMPAGKTWTLTEKDKACTVRVPQDAPGSACNCPAGTAVDLTTVAYSQAPAKINEQDKTLQHKAMADQCTSNRLFASYVDCGCFADKAAAFLEAHPGSPWSAYVDQAAAACPADKQTISDYNFKSCDSFFSTTRADHAEFCRCAGDKTADAYLAKPDMNLRYIEGLRKNALQSCRVDSK